MVDIRKIIEEAIHDKETLLITYVSQKGETSEREIEPFDIGPNKGTDGPDKLCDGPDKLWLWCLFHDYKEGKFLDKIKKIVRTGKKFDPSKRSIFNWNFNFPRDW